MGKKYLLDCTLRDGGYLNNWGFGEKTIWEVTEKLAKANVDVIEVGFLRDEENQKDRSVWNSPCAVMKDIPSRQKNVIYAAMVEIGNPLPLEKIPPRSAETVDVIRVIIWGSKLQESFDYCKGIAEKGYGVSIQVERTNQYSDEEFHALTRKFGEMHPFSLYVVDSNGVMCQRRILEYLKIADEELPHDTILGYHGHNNRLQTVGAAESFVELGLKRDIIIDGSIRGIGRSSGNLHTELFAEYMNEYWSTSYDIPTMLEIYQEYIDPIYQKTPWGFSMETFITARHICNSAYADFFTNDYPLTLREMDGVISLFTDRDRVVKNKNALPDYIAQYKAMETENAHDDKREENKI